MNDITDKTKVTAMDYWNELGPKVVLPIILTLFTIQGIDILSGDYHSHKWATNKKIISQTYNAKKDSLENVYNLKLDSLKNTYDFKLDSLKKDYENQLKSNYKKNHKPFSFKDL